MPHWYSNHGHSGLSSSLSSGHHSSTSSAPPSRPSSPTRSTRSTGPSSINVPSRESTLDPSDPLSEYLGGGGPPSSASSQPLYGPYSVSSDMHIGGSGTQTPGGSYGNSYGGSYFNLPPVEIVLDSDHLVLRGQGGDMNPAYLSGQIVLNLHESTNIKEIVMNLTGKAKVHFSEGSGTGSRSHSYTHPVITHDWSFLEGNKRHTHTLKAGRHTFPFSFTIDGNLPSTVRTYTGDAAITYKLRATVVRSGLASNYMTTKGFTLMRTFTPEALEFNQTLEIENTWPGKVMYSLTLPHKAYAAGDDIPINVKFMPLAKGVRVLSIVSVVKEYTLVHTRSSSHPDARVAVSVKHELRNGQAYEVPSEAFYPRAPAGYQPEVHQTPSFTPGFENPRSHYVGSRQNSMISGHSSVSQSNASPSRTPMAPSSRLPAFGDRPPDSYFPGVAAPVESPNAVAGSSTSQEVSEDDIEIGDDEINTSLSVPIPSWTTPSHVVHPVFVTHKIKWSCSISNPDGHISELRCALPIHIIDNSLLDEAHTAGAQTRALLFGGDAAEEAQQVDLPSYSNHVYDRVAVADSGATASGFTARSVHATPMHSPSATPPHSRPSSRPGSPNRGFRQGDELHAGDVPPRPELSSWADSELLLSLGALNVGSRPNSHENSPGETPPDSRGHSRPQSRSGFRSGRNSNPGSRSGSRASSPERSQPSSASSSYAANDDSAIHRPIPDRRGSGFHNLLHLPSSLKPMKPLSALGAGKAPILRNGSAANLVAERSGAGSGGITRNAFSFTNLVSSHQNGNGPAQGVSFAPTPERPAESRRARFQVDGPVTPTTEDVDPMSQVPSYAIASRGFLGGGVTPIALDLPTYDASERAIERSRSELDVGDLGRARSDSALVALGADAAAQAEGRAAEEGEGEQGQA